LHEQVDTVAVDWSGAVGGRTHIALARARDGRLVELRSHLSREEAFEALVELGTAVEQLVVGIDFAFSMPEWFVRSLGVDTARDLWGLVASRGEGWLEACEPPFWGRPGRVRPSLEEHLRRTEASLDRVGGIGVKSVFQIGGAGAVGTASLRGMPYLARLQDAGFAIWPFDDPRFPLVCEIYPRLLTGPVLKGDRASREEYLLDMRWLGADPALVDAVASSEDAFDAAVSAVVMSRNAAELQALGQVDDPVLRLEGQIWAPPPARRPDDDPLPDPPDAASEGAPSRAAAAAPGGARYGPRYMDALTLAAQLHANQYRKGTNIPYLAHLLAVSSSVWEAGGDEDQAIAGLLHDAVEDQGGAPTLETIRRRFGDRVAMIVDVCTDADRVPKPPWRARKEEHISRIATAPLEALVVVAADKLHNARSILADVRAGGAGIWDRFKGGHEGTLWYYKAMLGMLAERDPSCPLVPQLELVVAELAELPAS
jgi:hypothetical protein